MAINVYEIVTNKIIEQLEKGIIPWRKTWQGSKAINYITRKPYQGINILLLPFGGEYLTFNQCKQAGGIVRKGEKAHLIVFYKLIESEDENGEKKTIPFLQYSNVFHISQCEGIKSKLENIQIDETIKPIENAQRIIDSYINTSKVKVNNIIGSDRAFYNPNDDSITLPIIGQFENNAEYYSTAFHELAHSTGHKNRLNRINKVSSFGNAEYSKEELIAEISASMIMEYVGVKQQEVFENSVNYIGGWLKVLKGDNKIIVSASNQAQKASNLILGIGD